MECGGRLGWVLLACTAGVLACVACGERARGEERAVTTTFVVCPGEVTGTGPDLRLTEAGLGRAADLRDVLQSSAVEAVYAAGSTAASMTAAPTAAGAGLQVQVGALPEASDLVLRHPGRSVLVVTDPDQLASVVHRLGGPVDLAIGTDEADNLFILQLEGSTAQVARWRYGPLARLDALTITGEVGEGLDVSGVARVGADLFICSDEGTSIQELVHQVDGSYAAQVPLPLTDDEEVRELDLEGLAADGQDLYAVGSHSLRRLRASRKTYRKNRQQLETVTAGGQQRRDRIFRIRRTTTGGFGVDGAVNLRGLLEEDPYLGRFAAVAGKENGIDIEGLAVDGERLVLGLRGPVLRGNFTPVLFLQMSAQFKQVKRSELRFVQLDGRGIRGLAKVATGFLLIAGPVSDLALPYRLYHWDGEDMLPGERAAEDSSAHPGRVTLLGTISTPPGGKAEGLAVLAESEAAYEILIVFDEAVAGAPTRFRVRKLPGL